MSGWQLCIDDGALDDAGQGDQPSRSSDAAALPPDAASDHSSEKVALQESLPQTAESQKGPRAGVDAYQKEQQISDDKSEAADDWGAFVT